MEMEMEMEMEQFLPIEIIITEILSRLTVDSVIQYKCVCKTWRSLIDDPAFADVHTHRLISMSSDQKKSAENHSNSSSSVVAYDSLFLVRESSNSFQYCYVEYNDDNRITLKPSTNKSLPFPLESMDSSWKVSSSCNGLIFMFTKYKHMIVCNPCTREYVNLLVPNLPNHTFLAAHGFGYLPHTKEYKIVIITYKYEYVLVTRMEKVLRMEKVMVYTLGSGRWRSKGKQLHIVTMILNGTGVLVNGALHWILKNSRKEIVLFDLEDEEFRVVPATPSLPAATHLDLIGMYAGSLCVLATTSSYYKSKSSDIWVTKNKEYSWTREFSIPWNYEEKLSWSLFLGCLKGGKILLCSHKHLISYDPETDSFEKNESLLIMILNGSHGFLTRRPLSLSRQSEKKIQSTYRFEKPARQLPNEWLLLNSKLKIYIVSIEEFDDRDPVFQNLSGIS